MKILGDYHVHSAFSADSSEAMERMVEQGMQLGLQHICFTDHMDYDFPAQYLETEKKFEFDVDVYFDQIKKLQNTYKSDIQIHIGVELGVKPNIVSQLEKLVTSYPFDFVIASSHLLDNYDPYFPDYWAHIDNHSETGIRAYFQSIYENIQAFDNFDVYGHLDYIVRYIPDPLFAYHPEQFQEEIDRILKLLIKKGKGIEINTAGLKYGLPFAHPKEEIVTRFFDLGGSYYTVGSDAHKAEHLGYAFAEEAITLDKLGLPAPSLFVARSIINKW